MVIEKQHMNLNDLLALGEDSRIEIVNWELIEMPAAGGVHQIIAMNIIRLIDAYVQKHDIGVVMPDQMTYLMNSPTSGLKDSFVPDVSYFSHDSVPENWDTYKPHPGAPDLAVEIVSPGDDIGIVHAKVNTYLEQGTKQIWLVLPKQKEIHQYIHDKPNVINKYKGSNTLDAGALFPDIDGLTTDAIFKLPKWAVKDEK